MMMKAFSEILREITGGIEPIMTVKEISSVCRVHEQTVYSWKNDHTEPGYSKIMDLSCYLIKEKGYYGLASQFSTVCHGKANGRVEDDLLNIYEAGTDLHRAFRESIATDYINALARMKREIKDLEKEGEQL